MSLGARDLLTRGIASAKAGEAKLARRYLERSLRMQPSTRQRVDALYWLAQLSESDDEKRGHLESVLQLEASHFAARRDLAILEGELSPSEIIQPDAPQAPAAPEMASLEERRYVCPNCGGRMKYQAETAQLTCSYCGFVAKVEEVRPAGKQVAEQDFIEALATAKGHIHPQATPTFTCGACGATYLLAPQALSLTCPHCGASYVIERTDSRSLVPPQGIVPFALSAEEAGRQLRDWLASEAVEGITDFGAIRGLYLPAWTFDISGDVPYQYQRQKGDRWVTENGAELLLYNDLPVAASQRLPATFLDEIHEFDLTHMKPYDSSHLAGWPAETYGISATEAAMAARWYVLERARDKAWDGTFGRVRGFRFSASNLLVSAYRLILLPIYLTRYRAGGERFPAMVNGQTGQVHGEKPRSGLGDFLRRLFGPG